MFYPEVKLAIRIWVAKLKHTVSEEQKNKKQKTKIVQRN